MINKIKTTLSKLLLPKSKGKMKAIVTGGNGFIGSHIVDELVNNKKFDEIYLKFTKVGNQFTTKIEDG